MKAIGAKTVAALGLLGGAAILVWRRGLVRPDYLLQLDPWVPFFAGGFAVLGAALTFRFGRLGHRSDYSLQLRGIRFAIGRSGQRGALELPAVLQLVLYGVAFFCLALAVLDNRAVALLGEIPEALARPSVDFCADPTEERQEEPGMQGCRLVLRAYDLGYASTLGSCAPGARRAKTRVCQLRQRDEPYLHYAWRLLAAGTHAIVSSARASSLEGSVRRFRGQLDRIGVLSRAELDAIDSGPRASHHLFTNLPDPEPPPADLPALLRASTSECSDRYSGMPHLPEMTGGPAGAGRLVDHVLGQLLFNSTYRPIVASCRELSIHWGAPADACARLAEDPRGLLSRMEALDPVAEVLERRARNVALGRPAAAPDRIVSFQCLIVGAGNSQVPTERTATLGGIGFVVREMRRERVSTDVRGLVDLYKTLAGLFAGGFGYGRLVSREAVATEEPQTPMAQLFGDRDFMLSRLEMLRDADLFLGHEWLYDRPDLLAVYPYHVHLKNFVEVFRQAYRLHRGRL